MRCTSGRLPPVGLSQPVVLNMANVSLVAGCNVYDLLSIDVVSQSLIFIGYWYGV
jgi:hypothetical protein